eukprot:6339553-Alexandrium_andersonii.AAC.1
MAQERAEEAAETQDLERGGSAAAASAGVADESGLGTLPDPEGQVADILVYETCGQEAPPPYPARAERGR